MESRGNVGYPKEAGGGPESFASTMHWGADWTTNQYAKTHAEKSIGSGTLADDFHTYGLYWDDKVIYTYLDDDSNRVLSVDHSSQSYWDRSGLNNRANPWTTSKNKCAPFDRPFYLIINLAVGGTNGYFPDGVGSKPWSDKSQRASSEFYDNKGQWWPSWGDHSTFQIDSVKMWDLTPTTPEEEPTTVKKESILSKIASWLTINQE